MYESLHQPTTPKNWSYKDDLSFIPLILSSILPLRYTETEFLGVIGTKVLRDFLLDIHSHLYYGFSSPLPPLSKSGLKLNVNTVYGKISSLRTQDYAQKPQRNCTFMNSASGHKGAVIQCLRPTLKDNTNEKISRTHSCKQYRNRKQNTENSPKKSHEAVSLK